MTIQSTQEGMTETVQPQITQAEALLLAAAAIRELLADPKYSNTERWMRMFPADRIPPQARRDGERRALLLMVADTLEGRAG